MLSTRNREFQVISSCRSLEMTLSLLCLRHSSAEGAVVSLVLVAPATSFARESSAVMPAIWRSYSPASSSGAPQVKSPTCQPYPSR